MNLGIEVHLKNKIIPFWKQLIDREFGGFYGHVDYDLQIQKQSSKSLISAARHLYTFSLWYDYFKEEELLTYAHHAYQFLKKYKDTCEQGYFWMLDHQGQVMNSTKHIYGQVFVIYGLSEYYLITKDQKVLDEALELYHLIEEKAKIKPFHYHEAFDRDWHQTDNDLLSAHGPHFIYTTNTLLHMLEAYTNLYKASQANYVKEKIEELLNGFVEELYDSNNQLISMYLDKDRVVASIGQSYGHDIESCWLIDWALHETGLDHSKVKQMTHDLCTHVYVRAMTNKGLLSENILNHLSKDRIWWIQAEAMVGFYNHYQKTNDSNYLQAVESIYQFILDHIVDPRDHAEWLWGVDEHLKPLTYRGFAEPWKVNYHNGRALIELLKRGVK
jgi:cellobiose epimerase